MKSVAVSSVHILYAYRNTALQNKVKKYQLYADFLTIVGEKHLNWRGMQITRFFIHNLVVHYVAIVCLVIKLFGIIMLQKLMVHRHHAMP